MPDASRLFDLMRNLGGAIGLALIDTVIYGRLLFLGAAIRDRLQAGDFATAKSVGLPLDIFAQRPAGAARRRRPEQCWRHSSNRRRWPQAINEAWAMVAALTVVGLLCVPLARRSRVPSLE